jgi:hypothetical protein
LQRTDTHTPATRVVRPLSVGAIACPMLCRRAKSIFRSHEKN